MPRWIQSSRFSFLKNLSLVIGSGLIALFLFDWIFIKYEHTFLLSSSKDIQLSKNKTFDLIPWVLKKNEFLLPKAPTPCGY